MSTITAVLSILWALSAFAGYAFTARSPDRGQMARILIGSMAVNVGLLVAMLWSTHRDRVQAPGETCVRLVIDRGEVECTLWEQP